MQQLIFFARIGLGIILEMVGWDSELRIGCRVESRIEV